MANLQTHKPKTAPSSLPNSAIIGDTSSSNSQKKGNTLLSMVKMEPLQKMIECVLLSPYIKDEKPLSLLIVAKPESGKTSVMKAYRENKGIVYVTDCTAYGLTREVLPKMVSGEIKTIMIPDLLTPLSKAHKTRQSFIAFLNNLIEEGVAKIATYAMIWDRNVKANVITAVTDQALFDGRHEWAKMGFLSRFIVFSYSYNISTVVQILNLYSQRGLATRNMKVKLPRRYATVHLPDHMADQLNPIAMKIGQQCELYGIRAKINLRTLLKCLALRNKSSEVTEKEYQEFLELADYLNFKLNPL
ncbi:MAG: hypothetical protein NWE77_02715 [Candidatus Bathyarchaeota archaeon]|nr:hypothetical protein [Candidatus Bathyarchaeota archaeon]